MQSEPYLGQHDTIGSPMVQTTGVATEGSEVLILLIILRFCRSFSHVVYPDVFKFVK